MTQAAAANAAAATGLAAVTARQLKKSFGDRDALAGVDLEIPRGSCFGLFGPNGSGKTTLLKIVATQLSSTAGEVEVLGERLPKNALAVRAQLGILLDRPLVPLDFTLAEALRYHAELYNVPDAKDRIDKHVEAMGLVWRTRDPIRTFSRGMAQRVSLICALLAEPELLILDEPFTGLDRQGCELVEAAIEQQVAAGRSVILVTHDLERGERLCSEIAVLDQGRLVFRGYEGQWGADELTAVYR